MGSPRPHLRDRPSEKRHKGSTRSAKVEARATYVMELEAEFVTMGYAEVVDAVRKKFDCGFTAARDAITRAHERQREANREGDPDLTAKVASMYLRLAEQAAADKKYNAARLNLDSYRATLGLGVPDRMIVTEGDSSDDDMEPLTDEELRLLAKLDSSRAPSSTEH